jgi:hypothetical protein
MLMAGQAAGGITVQDASLAAEVHEMVSFCPEEKILCFFIAMMSMIHRHVPIHTEPG